MTSGGERREDDQRESSDGRAAESSETAEPSRDDGNRDAVSDSPRDSESPETRTGSEATREREGERGEPSEESSGERRDPRDGEDPESMLNIAGHENRERPDDAKSMLGSDADSDDSEESTGTDADGDGEDEEVRPVEVLVALAKDGEIEPWDIDIVTVTDKFLDRLDEADLRTSGRALFYASVLLRMKSDAMLSDDDPAEAEPEPWEAAARGEETPIDPGADPFAELDAEMERRLDRKRARGMPQTLDELVRDLREAERDTWWKESREYDTSDSPQGFSRGTQELDYRAGDEFRMDDEPSVADVTGTAHAEDIDTIIDDVYGACLEQWEAGRDEVLYDEIAESGGTRVETFLGLLFLAHRGQVRLQQDDLFGDLWVQDPNAVQGSEEAVAD